MGVREIAMKLSDEESEHFESEINDMMMSGLIKIETDDDGKEIVILTNQGFEYAKKMHWTTPDQDEKWREMHDTG